MSDTNLTDYLQNLRVRPPKSSPSGLERTISGSGVLYQLESKKDAQKYKLDDQNDLNHQRAVKNHTRVRNNPSDMIFAKKEPDNLNKNRFNTGRSVRGLSVNLKIDQDKYVNTVIFPSLLYM